ncbi:MAG: YfhO family protein, partial [Candidatus Eremiobacterota bacterium]
RLRGDPPAALARCAAGICLGLGLAAPLLIPTAITMLDSQRPRLPLEFLQQTYREFLATSWPTFVFPDAWGTPVNHFALVRIPSGGNFIYPELVAFCGVVPLLLAGVAATRSGLGRTCFWTAVVLLILPATPLYGLLYPLPGFNRVIATRILFLFGFFISLAGGFGLDALRGRSARAVGILALLLAVGLAFGVARVQRLPEASVEEWMARGAVRLPDRDLFLDDASYRAAVRAGFRRNYAWTNPSVWLPLMALALAAAALASQRRSLLLALAAVELMGFAWRFNPAVDRRLVYPVTPPLEFLRQNAGLDRVLGLSTVKPNSLLPLQLQDVGGYDSFYPRSTALTMSQLLLGRVDPGRFLPAQVFGFRRTSPLVDLLGVRYVVAYPQDELPGYRLVLQAPLKIYENPNRIPRAFVVGPHRLVAGPAEAAALLDAGQVDPRQVVLLEEDPGVLRDGSGSAEIVHYGLNRVRLDARTSDPAWLVFTDAFAPGWRALVDGRPARIWRADGMFRAVELPEGSSRVEFVYIPPSLGVGLWLGLASLVGILVAATRKATSSEVAGPEEGSVTP